jgi:hypothetical protein
VHDGPAIQLIFGAMYDPPQAHCEVSVQERLLIGPTRNSGVPGGSNWQG